MSLQVPSASSDPLAQSTGSTSSSMSTASSSAQPPHKDHKEHKSSDDDRKLFAGGLDWNSSEDTLKSYFSAYGTVVDVVVMRGPMGRSRGFGFVTFSSPAAVNEVLKHGPHTIDGRTIDPKRAVPRANSSSSGNGHSNNSNASRSSSASTLTPSASSSSLVFHPNNQYQHHQHPHLPAVHQLANSGQANRQPLVQQAVGDGLVMMVPHYVVPISSQQQQAQQQQQQQQGPPQPHSQSPQQSPLSPGQSPVLAAGNAAAPAPNGSTGPFRNKKIFVGGLPPEATEQNLAEYFGIFGEIEDVILQKDRETGRPRGFGFVTFATEEAVNRTLEHQFHDLLDRKVEVKRAIPKNQVHRTVLPMMDPALAAASMNAVAMAPAMMAAMPRPQGPRGPAMNAMAMGSGAGNRNMRPPPLRPTMVPAGAPTFYPGAAGAPNVSSPSGPRPMPVPPNAGFTGYEGMYMTPYGMYPAPYNRMPYGVPSPTYNMAPNGFSFDAMYGALPATQGAVPGSPTRFDANAFSEAQMQAAVMASGFRPEMYMAAMQGQFLSPEAMAAAGMPMHPAMSVASSEASFPTPPPLATQGPQGNQPRKTAEGYTIL